MKLQEIEAENKSESSDGEGDEEEEEQEKKWDCETILTTYTNTDNHPGVIKAVIKPRKFMMPRIDLRPKHEPVKGGFKVVEEPAEIESKPIPATEQASDLTEIKEESAQEANESAPAPDTAAEVDISTLTPRSLKKHLRKQNKKEAKEEK